MFWNKMLLNFAENDSDQLGALDTQGCKPLNKVNHFLITL